MKTKRIIALAFALFGVAVALSAKGRTDQDFVEMTLWSGEKLTGYVVDTWTDPYKLQPKQNFRFSIVPERDSERGDKDWYTAMEVSTVVFSRCSPVKKYESHKVANRTIWDKDASSWAFVFIEEDRDATALCSWNVGTVEGEGQTVVNVVKMYGILVKADGVVYPFIRGKDVTSSIIEGHLKKKRSKFVKDFKKYIEKKSNKKALLQNPAQMLDFYQEYLDSEAATK